MTAIEKAKELLVDAFRSHPDDVLASDEIESIVDMIVEAANPSRPAGEPMLQWFQYEDPAAIETPFCDLARQVVCRLPQSAQRTVCLRKLLESKDAATRAEASR